VITVFAAISWYFFNRIKTIPFIFCEASLALSASFVSIQTKISESQRGKQNATLSRSPVHEM